MKKEEIVEGRTYLAKVSGQMVKVRVDEIRTTKAGPKVRAYSGRKTQRETTLYYVTNLRTDRKCCFRSAQKFHPVPVEQYKFLVWCNRDGVVDAAHTAYDTKAEAEQLKSLKLQEAGVELSAVTKAPSPEAAIERCAEMWAEAIAAIKADAAKPAAAPRAEEKPAKGNKAKAPAIRSKGSLASRILAAGGSPSHKPSKLQPTAEQQAILDAVQVGHPVLIIKAGAGTGKTSSLRMIADVLDGNGQYTAFNSKLVAGSKDKFEGTRVACNTTHSLAFRAEGKKFGHRLDSHRVRSDQIATMLEIGSVTVELGGGVTKTLAPAYLAGQVMQAIRRYCQSDDRDLKDSHFRYIDGIDLPTAEGVRTYDNNEKVRAYLIGFARAAWRDLCNPEGQLPFSHDHYVKIWQLNKPVIAGDYVLLDEAQDTAPVMLDVLRQQKVPVILVGDDAQQIYEWRGAINAMAAFGDAPCLLLSQSFRFGEAIAEVANAVLNTLEEPTALRLKGLPSIPSKVCPVAEPTAILCRTNATAVSSLLGAIAEGKRPFLVGGGSEVVSFVEGALALQEGRRTSHPDLACFDTWGEVQEYSKQDEGEDLKLMVKLIDSFGARVIIDALKAMPAEGDADLVISTAHKSKGLEWRSVRLANDFPTQNKCADSDRKLLYVAVTRAMLELDVSQCPFFTGQDALDISAIAAKYRETVGEDAGLLPPAPSTAPPPSRFTWTKWRDKEWLVRGPAGKKGEVVQVFRKDDSSERRTLTEVVWEDPLAGVQVYRHVR